MMLRYLWYLKLGKSHSHLSEDLHAYYNNKYYAERVLYAVYIFWFNRLQSMFLELLL